MFAFRLNPESLMPSTQILPQSLLPKDEFCLNFLTGILIIS